MKINLDDLKDLRICEECSIIYMPEIEYGILGVKRRVVQNEDICKRCKGLKEQGK